MLLTFAGAFALGQLADELAAAAIPELAPLAGDRLPIAVWSLAGNLGADGWSCTELELELPELEQAPALALEAKVSAIVKAHVPVPPAAAAPPPTLNETIAQVAAAAAVAAISAVTPLTPAQEQAATAAAELAAAPPLAEPPTPSGMVV